MIPPAIRAREIAVGSETTEPVAAAGEKRAKGDGGSGRRVEIASARGPPLAGSGGYCHVTWKRVNSHK